MMRSWHALTCTTSIISCNATLLLSNYLPRSLTKTVAQKTNPLDEPTREPFLRDRIYFVSIVIA